MKPLEDMLREALRRQEPPEGFSRRVISRIEDKRSARWKPLSMFFKAPALRWLAASAAAVVLVIGLVVHQQRVRQRIEAQRDGQQALVALRIADQKLNEAFARVAGAGHSVPGDPAKSVSSEEEP